MQSSEPLVRIVRENEVGQNLGRLGEAWDQEPTLYPSVDRGAEFLYLAPVLVFGGRSS